MPSGYYRFPTLHDDTLVFVCEDDLWSVSAGGGLARRLTSGLGEATRPALSRDGAHLAFVGREEGQSEMYVMPALGGPPRRLTYLGDAIVQTAGWTPDGRIAFASNAGQPFTRAMRLHAVSPEGGQPQEINVGLAQSVAFGPGGAVVIGRNTTEPARWKRYRGGTAGHLWIDPNGSGEFRPLIRLNGNVASPVWHGERIYFVSDHEGVGNLYSCLPTGADLRRHTDHADFYVRNPAGDGRRIVYHAGADLYLYDPEIDSARQIPIDFHSPQTQRSRRFVSAGKYLHDWAAHPNGQSVAISTRGQVFAFANWEGAALNLHSADTDGARYRLPQWLNDGKRLIAVTDSGGEETLVILRADASAPPERLPTLDIGRPFAIAVHPRKDKIAFSNHRYELIVLDLVSHELKLVDRGKSAPIAGFDWSHDGAWLAYSVSLSLQVAALKLWKADTGETFPLTRPVLRDVAPAFDPQGKYLYFLSYRHFDPVYDNLHFDLNFPRGVKPFLITLQKDQASPFVPVPKAPNDKKDDKDKDKEKEKEKEKDTPAEEDKPEADEKGVEDKAAPAKESGDEHEPMRIDLEGIEERVIAFPVDDGRFGRVMGLKDGKVLYTRFPIEGALNQSWVPAEPPAKGALMVYDFDAQDEEFLIGNISDFALSRDHSTLIYRAGARLRVLKAGDKPDREAGSSPSRKSGWLDLSRVSVSVRPAAEWRQMLREAWRLQRDQFWTSDMSRIDWLAVYDRYLPLADRVSSRSEFSDLMWEMQGELGTSHAYEIGGDYRPERNYAQGLLAADFAFDEAHDGWRITHIVRGDPWDERAGSPLSGAGVNAREGDVLLAVNGRRLSRAISPAECLVNLAASEVSLTLLALSANGSEPPAPRTVTVTTLRSEMPARYREWVETNRRLVHEATSGRVGYVHVPDMGPRGYAEFHRGYLAEVDREGLVVDLRYNGGGHVSALILEKLARRRLGYDVSRWGEQPSPYPPESVFGPLVALTNEYAGSDGDIFSQGFKMLKLGPLVGTRTWGGVIGIDPRQILVDGTVTTQPEFSFWFQEIGWGVENYGVDPDIEVINRPQDYVRGIDPQLDRTIAEILAALEANPPRLPDFSVRPSLSVPRLPERETK